MPINAERDWLQQVQASSARQLIGHASVAAHAGQAHAALKAHATLSNMSLSHCTRILCIGLVMLTWPSMLVKLTLHVARQPAVKLAGAVSCRSLTAFVSSTTTALVAFSGSE